MTPDDLDRLEALAAAATPGPRYADPDVLALMPGERPNDDGPLPQEIALVNPFFASNSRDQQRAELAFLAALSPSVVSELIAAARLGAAWRALQETLEAEHDKVCLCPFDGTDPGCNFVMTDAAMPALLSLAEALRGRK